MKKKTLWERHRALCVLLIILATILVAAAFLAFGHFFYVEEGDSSLGGCEGPAGRRAQQIESMPDASRSLTAAESRAVGRYLRMLQAKSEGRQDLIASYPAGEMRRVSKEYLTPGNGAQWIRFSRIRVLDPHLHESRTTLLIAFDETSWICPGGNFTGCSTQPSYGIESEASDIYHRLTFQRFVNSRELTLTGDEPYDPTMEEEADVVPCPIPWFDLWDRAGGSLHH